MPNPIICAKCGRHFSLIEEARSHKCPGHERFSRLRSTRGFSKKTGSKPPRAKIPIKGSSSRSEKAVSKKSLLAYLLLTMVVLSLIGVEPLATYRRSLGNLVSSLWEETATPPTKGTIWTVEFPEPPPTYEPPSVSFIELPHPKGRVLEVESTEEIGYRIYRLINKERELRGLSPLQPKPILTQLAQEQSEYIAELNYLTHDRPASKTFDLGQEPGTVRGENSFQMPQQLTIPGPLLSMDALAEEMIKGWMGSPGHRANILTEYFDYTGIGVTKRNDYFWVVQLFEGAY